MPMMQDLMASGSAGVHSLKVKQAGSTGRVVHVTPESAGWTYVGFDLLRLRRGETAQGGRRV